MAMLGYLGEARVSGEARVFGNALVFGEARVSGSAQVFGEARVSGICTKTPVTIAGLYYDLTITDNHLRAGCQVHQFRDWLTKTDRELLQMDGKPAVKFYHETLKPLMLAINFK